MTAHARSQCHGYTKDRLRRRRHLCPTLDRERRGQAPQPRRGAPKAQGLTAAIAVAAPSPGPSIALKSTGVSARCSWSQHPAATASAHTPRVIGPIGALERFVAHRYSGRRVRAEVVPEATLSDPSVPKACASYSNTKLLLCKSLGWTPWISSELALSSAISVLPPDAVLCA